MAPVIRPYQLLAVSIPTFAAIFFTLFYFRKKKLLRDRDHIPIDHQQNSSRVTTNRQQSVTLVSKEYSVSTSSSIVADNNQVDYSEEVANAIKKAARDLETAAPIEEIVNENEFEMSSSCPLNLSANIVFRVEELTGSRNKNNNNNSNRDFLMDTQTMAVLSYSSEKKLSKLSNQSHRHPIIAHDKTAIRLNSHIINEADVYENGQSATPDTTIINHTTQQKQEGKRGYFRGCRSKPFDQLEILIVPEDAVQNKKEELINKRNFADVGVVNNNRPSVPSLNTTVVGTVDYTVSDNLNGHVEDDDRKSCSRTDRNIIIHNVGTTVLSDNGVAIINDVNDSQSQNGNNDSSTTRQKQQNRRGCCRGCRSKPLDEPEEISIVVAENAARDKKEKSIIDKRNFTDVETSNDNEAPSDTIAIRDNDTRSRNCNKDEDATLLPSSTSSITNVGNGISSLDNNVDQKKRTDGIDENDQHGKHKSSVKKVQRSGQPSSNFVRNIDAAEIEKTVRTDGRVFNNDEVNDKAQSNGSTEDVTIKNNVPRFTNNNSSSTNDKEQLLHKRMQNNNKFNNNGDNVNRTKNTELRNNNNNNNNNNNSNNSSMNKVANNKWKNNGQSGKDDTAVKKDTHELQDTILRDNKNLFTGTSNISDSTNSASATSGRKKQIDSKEKSTVGNSSIISDSSNRKNLKESSVAKKSSSCCSVVSNSSAIKNEKVPLNGERQTATNNDNNNNANSTLNNRVDSSRSTASNSDSDKPLESSTDKTKTDTGNAVNYSTGKKSAAPITSFTSNRSCKIIGHNGFNHKNRNNRDRIVTSGYYDSSDNVRSKNCPETINRKDSDGGSCDDDGYNKVKHNTNSHNSGSNHNGNDHFVVTKAKIKDCDNIINNERDSANHSPVSGIFEGNNQQRNHFDTRSEGSTDSGKGRSEGTVTPSPPNCGSVSDDQTITIYQFEIQQEYVGKLIGKRGQFVNLVKTTTNTCVYIKKHPFSSTKKVCAIEGFQCDITAALEIIRARFPEDVYSDLSLEEYPIIPLAGAHELNTEFCQQLELIEGVNNDVIVSSLVSAGHLFVHQPTHPTYQQLMMLSMLMNENYNNTQTPAVVKPGVDMIVAAAAPIGGWYRAQVLSVNEEEEVCDVRFLDYGGYSTLRFCSLRAIRYDFMNLPFQAVECYLANVTPVDGIWSEEAKLFVESLTFAQILRAQVCDYSENGVPLILLYAIFGSQVVLINQELIAKGYAYDVTPATSIEWTTQKCDENRDNADKETEVIINNVQENELPRLPLSTEGDK